MFTFTNESTSIILQSLPSLRSIRFVSRRRKIDDDDVSNVVEPLKKNEVERPPTLPDDIDPQSAILLTGIRQRDWNFAHDYETLKSNDLPMVNYRLIPSLNNTLKNRSSTNEIQKKGNQYEEYDLDEQDWQWLVAYNQYRIDKHLPELDENIFEHVMQLLEQHCRTALQQLSNEDTIECDACRRLDDVDDLIQCVHCKTIVHQTCFGLINQEEPWTCLVCQEKSISAISCCLCGQSEGALKCLQNSSNSSRQWIHLCCAFWCPEIEFDEKNNPLTIEIPLDNDECSICHRTVGEKLVCSWKKCQCRFHAICAMRMGHDMFIVESDERNSVRLLALCHRHSEKIDSADRELQRKKSLQKQQQRLQQFASLVDLNAIKQQCEILPDIIDSIHAYWVLKRQANKNRPLIDLFDEVSDSSDEKIVNLKEFARRHHQDASKPRLNAQPNLLQCLSTPSILNKSTKKNFFDRFARLPRSAFTDYERNLFCLVNEEKMST